jgi:hypothetical protein
MQDGQSQPAWTEQTRQLVSMARAMNLDADSMRKVIDAFVNIDVAIKISQQTTRLLEEYKAGELDPTDFLDAILTILRTDKPLMGTKSQALHNALGVPMIQKAPRPKKAKAPAA